MSAAQAAPAAADVPLGPARGGLHADGVSVNRPGYPWHLMEGTVSAEHDARFRLRWSTWREAGAAAKGDGRTWDQLDPWARFAFDIVEEKARERDEWLGAEQTRRPLRLREGKPLRLILTGGAGSGKSTAIRALVRARRERTA